MLLRPGDPAPFFCQRSYSNPRYAFDTVAGRYVVLCFFGSAGNAHSQSALTAALSRPDLFNDRFASFFGVSTDPTDIEKKRIVERYPGYRFFLDFDHKINRLYGMVSLEETSAAPTARKGWLVLDPALRTLNYIPFRTDRSDISELFAVLDRLPAPDFSAGTELPVPVILVPRVFEPDLCQTLIDHFEHHGGDDSGFMRDVNGKTTLITDYSHKRRRDFEIRDKSLLSMIQQRFISRVVPEIQKVHQFRVTRMERYIVACYSAKDGGHFRPHRDNTTHGTAHRRFAVSVNLNDKFEGGEISFPEFSSRAFKMPIGAAMVFSCSLLHTVSKVTNGQRYAFLPFLYDEAAAKLRERNNKYLDQGVIRYQST